MKNPKYESMIKGPVTIVFTPLTKDGSKLNEEQLHKNVRFLINEGMGKECGVLVSGGSTSDCYVLSIEERKKVFSIVCEESKGKCPVFCGINSTSTNEAIELAQYAEKCGADGVMSTPPFYWINPTADTLYKHYKALSDNCSLGIMIYNNPNITGQDIPLETLQMLAEIKNVVALKECSANFIKFKLVLEDLSNKLVVINGAGEWIEPAGYQFGTKAYITAYGNMFPKLCIEIHKLASRGKFDEVSEIINKFKPLKTMLWDGVKQFGTSMEARMYKEMADILGFNEGGTRLPIMPLPEEWRRELKKAIEKIDFKLNN